MLGIHANSTLLRQPKVLTERLVSTSRGGSKKVKAAQSAHQATTHHHQNTFFSQDFNGVPLNLFRNNGSRYSAHIEAKAFSKLKSATLKITISTNRFDDDTAAVLAPLPHWFERIEIRTQNGSKHLATIYGDALMFNLNLIDTNQLPPVMKGANIAKDWSSTVEVNGNSTVSYYLPLVGTWFDSASIMTPGTAFEICCSTISLIIQTEALASEYIPVT